jgi:hypothetical protein
MVLPAKVFQDRVHKWQLNTLNLARVEAFICKAFKGAAKVNYCKPLLTPQMDGYDAPEG